MATADFPSSPKSSKSESARISEQEVDEVIEKIEAALPRIHERVKKSRSGTADSPTKAFKLTQIEKTRQAFEAMSQDSILTKSGEDIKLNGVNGAATPKVEPSKGEKEKEKEENELRVLSALKRSRKQA